MKNSMVMWKKAGSNIPRVSGALFEADKNVPLGGKIVSLVVEPLRIGEQEPVIFHLLAPPIARAGIALFHGLRGDIVDDGVAEARPARRLHVFEVDAAELPPMVVGIEQ